MSTIFSPVFFINTLLLGDIITVWIHNKDTLICWRPKFCQHTAFSISAQLYKRHKQTLRQRYSAVFFIVAHLKCIFASYRGECGGAWPLHLSLPLRFMRTVYAEKKRAYELKMLTCPLTPWWSAARPCQTAAALSHSLYRPEQQLSEGAASEWGLWI